MLLKSKKNTSHVQPKVKKTRKTKKKDILPEAESLLDKLNGKILSEKLNATNAALNEIGLLDSSGEDLDLVLDASKADGPKTSVEEDSPKTIVEEPVLDSSNEKMNISNSSQINTQPCLSSTKYSSPRDSPVKKTSRVRKTYYEVKIFNSIIDLDCFVRENNEYSVVTTHSNSPNCTQCTANCDNHKMSVIYRKCKCLNKRCALTYKITRCQSGTNWILYQNGEHPSESTNNTLENSINESISVRANSKQKPRQKHGVALKIIDIFNGWLKKDSSLTGQQLLNKLIQHRKSNSKKKPTEQNSRYAFSKHLIPSLQQVCIIYLELID